MTALLVTLGAFAFWGLIGLALLALVRADLMSLRVVLTAPSLGVCVTLLVLFVCSEAGAGIGSCALPAGIGLLLCALSILAVRRPRIHAGAAAVWGVCVGCLPLVAWPMFSLGFRWLANGNDDMANYVLSAQDLLHHGLLAPIDFGALRQGRDYATVLTSLHIAGARPGSDMLLAFVSRIAGRAPYEAFMPTILAFNLCGASAVGALALQATRRWGAAVLAAGLLSISPLASFGVLQQLLGQVLGLGLAAALCALLLRPELHDGQRPRVGDVMPIAVICGGLVFAYPELLPEVGLAYLGFLVVLAARKELTLSAVARLWLPVAAIVVVVLNSYLFTELNFLRLQSTHGLSGASYPPLFGYVLVPSGLPGIFGLQTLPPGLGAPHLNLTIVLAMVAIAGLLVACGAGARRGGAAALVLLVESVLGIVLVVKNSDFGIFKLMMYVQPFLAAFIAAWLVGSRRLFVGVIGGVVLVVLIVAQVSSQRAYVEASRAPSSVPNLSAADMVPAFHATVIHTHRPVVSVTENPVLIKLEAASAEGHSVYFQSRNVFSSFIAEYASLVKGGRRAGARLFTQSGPWVHRAFHLLDPKGTVNSFEDDEKASSTLNSGRCELVIPSGSQLPFNRLQLPASSPDLVTMPCTAPQDLLAFTSSSLGESFYLPLVRRAVSFFQLQQDPFFTDQTMVGFGRYALFRALGPTPGARLELSLTESLTHNGVNRLPPAAAVGAARVPLPLEGEGSARAFSPPLTPQMIDGAPYLMLDIGEDGRLPSSTHTGLQGLYSRSVPTDPRYLAGYVRDVSLVSAAQYASLTPPAAVSNFPTDLNNKALEYSGIYEDGWIGDHAYVRLAGGGGANLVVQGQVPLGAGKHLEALVNGRLVASLPVAAGPLNVRVPVPASKSTRRLELRFAATVPLAAPDLRPAAAHLSYLGFVAPAS